ncbi:MAG: hypothetical protein MUO26_13380 [Methanotrichaceae archaeon]|nr:hypothetical protein [Methanotrichaceae archaeon]
MTKCAYFDRECNSECAAWTGGNAGFTFVCARLEAEYDAANYYTTKRER